MQGQSSKVVESQDSNPGSLAPAPKLTTPDSPADPDGVANAGLEHSLSHPKARAPVSVPAGFINRREKVRKNVSQSPGGAVRMDPELHHLQTPKGKVLRLP